MPRHILTPEERARGHKLTHADRVRGGRNVPKAKRAKAALANPTHLAKLVEMGKPYRLTSERAKELAAISARVRRAQRAKALITLALGTGEAKTQPSAKLTRELQADPEAFGLVAAVSMSEAYPDHEECDPNLMGPVEAHALGASLAGKLMAGEGAIKALTAEAMKLHTVNPPPDPFTLSALKRFLPGPRSPLSLTRSQRAHVGIMRGAGYLTVTGDSMLALTEKGRLVVEAEAGDV